MAAFKTTVASLLTSILLAAGVGLPAHEGSAVPPERQSDPAAAPIAAGRVGSSPADHRDEPLPKYARARLGTARFHSGKSAGIAMYCPDGTALVSAGHGAIHVWVAATGRIVRDLGDAATDFRDVAVSPDGKTVATTEYPARLRLWDLATGRERRRWQEAKDESYEHLGFSPDGRTVAAGVTRVDRAAKTYERFINVWDTAAQTERRRRIAGDWLRLWDLKFSPDGRTLATASDDTRVNGAGQKVGPEKGSTRLWDISTGRERQRFSTEGRHVLSLAFAPDCRLLAAAVTDGTVRLYDLTTGQERLPTLSARASRPPGGHVATVPNGLRAMQCLAFSPDGAILAAGSAGGDRGDFSLESIHLWDVARGEELHRIPAHQQGVGSLSFSPDGKTLASTGVESAILFWDVASGREAFTQPGHRSGIRALVISPADGTVFTGGYDGTIRRWDPSSGRELGVIARFNNPADTLAIALDGKTLLVGGGLGGRFALWSTAEAREIRSFQRTEPRNPVRHVAFSPDGDTVASERRIWDVATGRVLVSFLDVDPINNFSANFFPIFYSADGKQLITSENEGVRIWDIASGVEARWAVRARIHQDRVALSRDCRFLASGGVVGRFRGGMVDPPTHVWELASGKEVALLEGHEESTNGLSFSPDGRLLASCSGSYQSSNDARVRVWDLAAGRELRRFEGHRGAVNAVAFTSDGRSVVSGSEDGTALVWDVADLRDSMKSDPPLAPETVQARWQELAGADARAAYRAAWALSVPSAVSFLRDHLRPAAAAEPITSPDVLRTLRAVTALERAGTLEARAVLEKMAQGDPEALETRDAHSALDRLNRSRPEIRASSSKR
jgi:WD40 repeat protein